MAPMPGLDWLTARPVAHRGLHDKAAGVIENSEDAVTAAIAGNYAIEVDIQETADGDAVVFHDFTLDRLTAETGPLAARSLAELEKIAIEGGKNTIISLKRLLEIVNGQVPLVVEIKSAETGSTRLAEIFAAQINGYTGPIASMSFDPRMVNALRKARPFLTRGLISYAYDDDEARQLPLRARLSRRFLLDAAGCSPHYIAYHCKALPAVGPWVCRKVLGMPVLSWTVRSQTEADRIAPHVDQIIFEQFEPRGG